MKPGYTLADLAMSNLEKIAGELEKVAFEPMLGGQPSQPPQGAPVDPAAQGAPQGAPMDPTAGAGAPAASLPPPAAAPAAPPASPSTDDMVNAIRQVMMEMNGGQGQGQAQGRSKGGKDVEERLGAIEAALAQVLQTLNLASPDQAVADAVSANAKQSPKGDVMSSGSGSADPGQGAMPMGPMDPNASAAMGNLKMPSSVGGVKMGSARPLDGTTQSMKLAAALKARR